MKDLTIGMKILATTTCSLDNEIFKLHPTTLVDAFENINYGGGLQIKLGKGLWGACPTRKRSAVAINRDEMKELAYKKLESFIEEHKGDKYGHNLYFIKSNPNAITINRMTFRNEVNSLREGSYKMYGGIYISYKLKGELPSNFFYNIDDAIDYFSKCFNF